MPRKAQHSKTALAELLLPVFQQYGYEGASISALSTATGLSKASLYHHFPNGKEDMGRHALAYLGGRLQRLILNPLDATDPTEALANALDGVRIYYDGAVPACLMNSLLVGDGAQLYSSDIGKAFAVWRQKLSDTLKRLRLSSREAEKSATAILERIQGALIICRVEGSRTALDDCITDIKAAYS